MTDTIKNRYTGEPITDTDGDPLTIASDLQGLDLENANLRDATLRDANLRHANLRNANLSGASLENAYLRHANLWGANLRDATLRGANLLGTSLEKAYLRHANLRDADLWSANLREANLRDATLQGAILREANLRGAILRGADLPAFEIMPAFETVPEAGSFIGYKKAGGHVVELHIPEDAERTSTLTGRKNRASHVETRSILDSDGNSCDATEVASDRDEAVVYREGETTVADEFDDDIRVEYSHGIHFFITKREAIDCWR